MSEQDEFAGKSFRECLDIIVYDPKDSDYTTRQINKIIELHEESNRKAVEVFANNLKLEIDDVLGGEVIWIREVIDQQIDDLKEPRKEAE